MKPSQLPSFDYLDTIFKYDARSGILYWKMGRRRCGGHPAGTPREKRKGAPVYLMVAIDRINYQVHRVIWKLVTGEEPPEQIDHEDTNPQNNQWSNLRAATNGQNIQNSRLRKDNKTGVKGLHWDHARKKWRGVVSVDNKAYFTGRFASRDGAILALAAMRVELHGKFARLA